MTGFRQAATTIREEAPRRSTAGKVMAERAVQSVTHHLKLKVMNILLLEGTWGHRMLDEHPVIPWLVEHAAGIKFAAGCRRMARRPTGC